MKLVVTDGPQQAAESAAAWLARRIRSAVERRGGCRLAVSGGTTPALMFDAIAAMSVPWAHLHLFQVDERVAPDGHPDRNATQLAEHLLSVAPIPRGNVHLMPVTAAALGRAAARYASRIDAAPLDIVHLGLGDDGHTASWPPGDPVIHAPGSVGISSLYNGRTRMTLTPAVVNAARARLVLATGANKARPLHAWLDLDEPLPIARVRKTNTTVVIDQAAARHLTAH